jgi:hypothetical protein
VASRSANSLPLVLFSSRSMMPRRIAGSSSRIESSMQELAEKA